MVAIFAGGGTGLERSSGNIIGAAGTIGSSGAGRGGNQVQVNAANGNLVIARQDEFLSAIGDDLTVLRIYNSQGDLSDTNGDNWRMGENRVLRGLIGTANGPNSSIERVGADGSVVTYYRSGSGYIATAGAGAHDRITWDGTNWRWQDGDSGTVETYGADLRLSRSTDRSGHVTQFAYTDGKLSRITGHDGGYLEYTWSGTLVTGITSVSQGTTTIRTRYGYDGYGRLSSVSVDRTAYDNSVADGDVYTTTYSYHGTSRLIASIGETDGSSLQIDYDGANRVRSIAQLVGGGVTRTTTLAYNGSNTVVTDQFGQATTLSYDGAGRLHGITAPPAVPGGAAQTVQFGYNVDNDLVSVTDAAGNVATYGYDANGNMLRRTDRLGDEVTRTYNAANQVLTETRTGSDRTSAAAAHTTRYVYDTLNRLRYVVSADGRVRETRYNSSGLTGFAIDYTAVRYDTAGLSATAPISETQLNDWRATADRARTSVTQFVYDARGNLTQRISFGATNAEGAPLQDVGYTHEYFVYDAAGQLLSRGPAGRTKETYSYDGLGRVIQSTDVHGGTTRITFDDAATRTTVTLANGFVETSTYSKSGELLNTIESGSYVTGGTASYQYDRLGRLRIMTDATGRKSYTVYDGAGRRAADVVGNGEMTEYRYDVNDRIVATVRYGTNIVIPAALNDPNGSVTVTVASLRPAANVVTDVWNWTVYDREGRVLQTIDGDGSTRVSAYDDSGRLVATTAYVARLTTEQLAAFRSAAPGIVTLPATSAGDSVSRVFYDRDGNIIGQLDGEGYLSQSVYDAGGRKTEDIGHASATAANLRVGGTFQALVDSTVAAGTGNDRSTRYVYDQQGYLRYSIDAIGRVTELGYQYDGWKWSAFGPVRVTTRYATTLGALSSYSFDAVRAAVAALAGNPANRTDWAVYDVGGRLTYAIDAAGAVTGYRYDNRGQVVAKVEYATVRSTTSLPSPESMNDWANGAKGASDRTTRFYHNARGELRYTIDAEGFVSRNDYDAEGRNVFTCRWSAAIAATDSWTIASVEAATSAIDPEIAMTARSYDAFGRISSVWDNAGRSTRYAYRANGQLTWEIRSQGKADEATTGYGYDLAGRRAWMTTAHGTADASTTSYVHDGLGNLVRTYDGVGAVTTWTYDRAGQMVTETDALNFVTRHQHDAFGNRVRTTDARGNSTYRYFDRMGRAVVVRDAENYVTETGYTVFGEIASIKRAYNRATDTAGVATLPSGYAAHSLDATTKFEYDRIGRVVKTTDAEGYAERYTLNAFGDRVSVTNKLGGVTLNDYDRRGLQTAQTLPITSVTADGQVQATSVVNRFEYDARGNRTRTTQAHGLTEERVTRYTYDKADRLIEVRGPSILYYDAAFEAHFTDLVASYRYDTRGNLIESRDANGARTLSFYDDHDRKVAQISPTGTLSAYTYDKTGNMLTSRVYGAAIGLPAEPGGTAPPAPGGDYRETSFSYDALGRLRSSSITDIRTGRWNGSAFVLTTAAITTGYRYDALGNLTAETDAEGASVFHYYDRNGRRIAQVDKEGYATRWWYNAEGNVVGERRYANQTSDAAAGVMATTVDSSADRLSDFDYDRNGNRTFEQRRNVDTVSVSGATIQATTGNSTIYYSYNGLGKVVRKTEATGESRNYSFDTMGRLVEEKGSYFVDNSTNELRPRMVYAYDGVGNLTRTKEGYIVNDPWGDRITQYHYDVAGRLVEKIDAAGAQTNYSHDAVGNVLQEKRDRQTSSGEVRTEAMLYVRDLSGRIVSQGMGYWGSGGWVRGDIQQTAYNTYGEISQRGMNGGWQEQFAYDRAGRVFRSNAGDGVWRYFVHDRTGNQTAVIESEGTAIEGKALDGMLSDATQGFAYALGQLYIDGINTSLAVYDRRGQATQSIQTNRQLHDGSIDVPEIQSTNIETGRAYNAFGEVAWERDARGYYTHMAYNTMGRMLWRQRPQVEVTDENGATRLVNPTEYFYYDQSGRAVASRDARGALTTRTLLAGTGYDGSEALVTRERTADGATVTRSYDQFRNLRIAWDGIGRVTRMDYDALGRLTQVTRPGGQSDSYAYDVLGQRIRHWDSHYGAANAEVTDYDMQGRVIRQVSTGGSEGIADVTTTTYSWSSTLATEGMGTFGGWVTTKTVANGRTSTGHADMFGRTVQSIDLGGRSTYSSFDLAGRLVMRNNGDPTRYDYLNTGLVGSIMNGEDRSETAPNNPGDSFRYRKVQYRYDAAGNRIAEYQTSRTGDWYHDSGGNYENEIEYNPDPSWIYQDVEISEQNAVVGYDALGRMVRWEEFGSGNYPGASLDYKYDENGNIRRSTANFHAIDQNNNTTAQAIQDNWYRYDAMNRVTLAKGQLVGGQIVTGYSGAGYQYDLAGQRVSSSRITGGTAWVQNPYDDYGSSTVVYYDAEQREEYGYDLDGRLTSVRIATQGYDDNGDGTVTASVMGKAELKATFGYDGAGRQTGQTDYLYDGDTNGTVAWQRVTTFNARGQVSNDTSWQRQGNDTIRTVATNYFGSGAGYALGSVISSNSTTYKNNSRQYTATTTNGYAWYAGAVLSSATYQQSGQSARTSSYYYDYTGQLSSVRIADGRPRNVMYTNDMTGQVIRRDESDNDYGKGDPHEVWYRFNGRTLGYVGNNGTQDTNYQASIGSRTRTQGTGPFDGGSAYGTSYADFDQSVAPITSFAQGAGGGSYTVRGGETLSGIAAQLWGDAGLWYKLAEANGLGGGSALVAGQSLTIPAGVQKSTHSAATFTPYDPAEAMGDTSPSVQPKAKKNKCGAFGAILLTVIAVAVTALTAVALPAAISPVLTGALSATAGSVVSQAVGVATGIQDRFDWKGVAMAGLSGAIGGALGNISPFGSGTDFLTGMANGAVRGAFGSFMTQGFAIATRMQKEMNWLGVATAAVGGGVAGGLGNVLKLQSLASDMSPANIARTTLTNTAAGIANAATRALATGTSFGDNVLAALPDVLGQTVGGVVAGAVAYRGNATLRADDFGGSDQMSQTEKMLVANAGASANAVSPEEANRSWSERGGSDGGRVPTTAETSPSDDAPGERSDEEIVLIANRDTLDAVRHASARGYYGTIHQNALDRNLESAEENYLFRIARIEDQSTSSLIGAGSLVLDGMPVFGTGKSIAQIYKGTDLITGEPISRWTESGALAVSMVPFGKVLGRGFAKFGTEAAERAPIVTDLGLSSGRYSLGAPVLQGFEANPGTIRAFGPAKGWSVGDDIYALTKGGNDPAWSTVRGRFWKNEATNPQNGTWNAGQLDRMGQGLAPQRYNFDKGGIESMDLSHEPIPFRSGGRNVVPRWPQDHAAIDPYRRPGY